MLRPSIPAQSSPALNKDAAVLNISQAIAHKMLSRSHEEGMACCGRQTAKLPCGDKDMDGM